MQSVRRSIGIGALVLGLALGWLLARDNSGLVTLSYFGQNTELKLWSFAVVAFFAGALLAGLIVSLKVFKQRVVVRRMRKQVAGLEKELHELRNLPVVTEIPNHDGTRRDEAAVAGSGGSD